MVARTRKQRQRSYGLVGHLAMLMLVSLFLTLLLLLVTAQGISARDQSALTTLQRNIPQEATPIPPTNTPLPTDTPTPLPPTSTPVPVGTETPTTAVSATNTPVVANTATTSGNGGGPGPTSPQSTEVGLSQPTVSS